MERVLLLLHNKESCSTIGMASLVVPPTRPVGFSKTRRGGKHYWTIHTHPNHAFSVRVNEDSQTAIVGFKQVDDALLVGQMIEKHYLLRKEWPDTDGQIILPSVTEEQTLNFLFCRKWDFEDLKVTCTKNFLNMIAIDEIESTKKGFEFNGKILSFEAPLEFYAERLTELYSQAEE